MEDMEEIAESSRARIVASRFGCEDSRFGRLVDDRGTSNFSSSISDFGHLLDNRGASTFPSSISN